LVEQLTDFQEAGEFEASAYSAVFADFGGELVLSFDPSGVGRGGEFCDAALA